MSTFSRARSLGLAGLVSLLGSCESLYGQFGVDNPQNCVVNSALCQAPDQACNPLTRECEPAIVISSIEPPAASVRGGDLATLTGLRFTPELRLRLGDREVGTVTVSSPSSLSFVVPPGPSPAGPVVIEVSHPAGQTQRRAGLFRYYEDVQLTAADPVSLPFTPKYARLSDFNRDGRSDVVLSDAFSSDVIVLLGGGDGSFQAPRLSTFSGRAFALATGDVDGDGSPDIAVSLTGPTGSIEVALGNGDGSFRTPVALATQTTVSGIAFGDFDEDGRADLVALDNQALRLWHSNGDGSFAAPSSLPLAYQGFTSARVVVADLDGDKHQDLVALNARDFNFPVLFGNGDGTFSEAQSPIYPGAPTGLALADCDGDGRLDILTPLSLGSTPVALTLQGGGRSFKQPSTFAGPSNLTLSELRDLNGDGVADIAVFNNQGTSGAFAILHGLGGGRFAPSRPYSLPPFPQLMLTAQLDGDSRPEVFVAHRGSSGSGNFYTVFRNVTP